MNSDDFEKRLQRQPLRRIPSEWREDILRGASRCRPSTLDPRPSFLSALLWPNPKAWIGLAAAWMLILALNRASKNQSPTMAATSKTSQTEMVANLKDQQKILVELMGSAEPRDTDKPRRLPAQPHSELHEPYSMA
jgi:hypothetical protein